MEDSLFSWFEEKAAREAEAFELAQSTFRIQNDGKTIPFAEGEGNYVLTRISSLVTSLGSKILNRKLDGIVGNIAVSASDSTKERSRQDYDLREMSRLVARDLVVKGSSGLVSTRDYGVYRMGGFTSPVNDPLNVDKRLSVFQGIQTSRNAWTVRIFQDGEVQEWRGVEKLRNILSAPYDTYQAEAFYSVFQADDAGMPLGEMEQIAPLLRAIMAVEARIHRVSELYGFPVPIIKGTIQTRPSHSPSNAIVVSENGDVKYLMPAEMGNLLEQKKDLVRNLDDVAILPVSSVLGYEPPSGEALKEASTSFNTNVSGYARHVSGLLSDAMSAHYGEEVDINVIANRVHDRDAELEGAVALLEKGLLPVSYVVRMLQGFYEDLTDDEADEVIQNYQAKRPLLTPEMLGL